MTSEFLINKEEKEFCDLILNVRQTHLHCDYKEIIDYWKPFSHISGLENIIAQNLEYIAFHKHLNGCYKDAIELRKEALNYDSVISNIRANLAISLDHLAFHKHLNGLYKDAIELRKEALKYYPNNPIIKSNLAISFEEFADYFFKVSKLSKAKKLYVKALEYDAYNVKIRNKLLSLEDEYKAFKNSLRLSGSTIKSSDEYNDIIISATRQFNENKTDEAKNNLANLLGFVADKALKSGNYNKAIMLYRKKLELDPDNIFTKMLLADTLCQSARESYFAENLDYDRDVNILTEAICIFKNILTQNTNHFSTKLALAESLDLLAMVKYENLEDKSSIKEHYLQCHNYYQECLKAEPYNANLKENYLGAMKTFAYSMLVYKDQNAFEELVPIIMEFDPSSIIGNYKIAVGLVKLSLNKLPNTSSKHTDYSYTLELAKKALSLLEEIPREDTAPYSEYIPKCAGLANWVQKYSNDHLVGEISDESDY